LRPGRVFREVSLEARSRACLSHQDWWDGHSIQCQSSSTGASQDGQPAGMCACRWRRRKPIGRILWISLVMKRCSGMLSERMAD
jgi:hypothetical protein